MRCRNSRATLNQTKITQTFYGQRDFVMRGARLLGYESGPVRFETSRRGEN